MWHQGYFIRLWELQTPPKKTKKKTKSNSERHTNTTHKKNTSSDKTLVYIKQRSQPAHNTIPVHFSTLKPAREEYDCSTKCHLWHIIRGSKCLGSCFRNKLLTAGDDETERIQNYSCTPQNLLNLLQPGACPSPSPWEEESEERAKETHKREGGRGVEEYSTF